MWHRHLLPLQMRKTFSVFSVPAACESLTEFSSPLHDPPLHSSNTQFAINWKKFTGLWAKSALKLLGSNILQHSRGMPLLPLSSRSIFWCFTVPNWMIQFNTDLRKSMRLLNAWELKKNPRGRVTIRKKRNKKKKTKQPNHWLGL